MKLTVDSLPSHFKPYTFKSFRMDAINFDQSQKLGAKPSTEDCRAIIGELTHGEIEDRSSWRTGGQRRTHSCQALID